MKHTYNQFMLHVSLNFALSFFGVPQINLLNKYTRLFSFLFWGGEQYVDTLTPCKQGLFRLHSHLFFDQSSSQSSESLYSGVAQNT